MKKMKKLTLFCLSVLTCFSLATAIACDGNSSNGNSSSDNNSQQESVESGAGGSSEENSSPEEELSYVYRIAVQHPSGFGLRDTRVSLKDGDKIIASATTNSSGYAYFRNDENAVDLGKYDVIIDELPAGYAYMNEGETYQTVAVPGTEVTIPLMPTGVMQGELPAGAIYHLGDVMYDFTATLSDGSTFTLSNVLQEKELVVINFWATWCGPCKDEFPMMNTALLQYEGVDCIAISTTDDKGSVASFKQSNNYSFNMAGQGAGNNLKDRFPGEGIPHTVMVDRYGVIVMNHVRSLPNLTDWTTRFDAFVGDEYTPTIWGMDDLPPEGDEDAPLVYVEPFVEPSSLGDVKTALNADDGFSFRYQAKDVLSKDDENYDKFSWGWTVRTGLDNNGSDISYIRPTNTAIPSNGFDTSVDYSYATLYADVTVKAGDILVFDYKIGSELKCDILYILIDGVIVKELSGYHSDKWNTCYAYVFTEDEAGEHEISFLFNKDYDKSAYDDEIYLTNLRLETLNDGIGNSTDTLIFRYAATVPNTDENAATQFKKYITPVLNEEDGYFHVGSADGPILFADLWYTTQWSNMSVWQLAYYDYCVVEGFNYHSAFEDYAWAANNNIISEMDMHGVVPVTPDLRDLLNIMTKYTPYNPDWDNFDGEWHENEWLEICFYYQPYGNTPHLEDTLKTITFDAAVEVFEGNNTVSVPFAMTPRGFKYKFIPEQSGIYHVFSTGGVDTFAFLVASDRKTFLGEWDDLVQAEVSKDENGVEMADGNFEFYWDFKAGETYYLLFTTFLDQVATYNVTIEYIGDTYTYMANAATAVYSANLVTGEIFLPDAVDYTYDEENDCYRYVDEEGNVGSPIYLDISRPTTFMWKTSLYDLAVYYINNDIPVEKRELYLKGVDYTDMVRKYGYKAIMTTGMYKGYVLVTKEIYDFLYALTVYSAHEGIADSWLTLCYYEKTIGNEN